MKYGRIVILGLLWIILIPLIGYFVLPISSPLPESKVFGSPLDWLGFWPMHLSAGGTIFLAYLTYKTLKQNEFLIKQSKTPQLSCALSIEKTGVGIKIINTSPTPAHSVKIRLYNKTKHDIIQGFEEICHNLELMTFEIPALGEKVIDIYGIEPHKVGNYEGYLTVSLCYHGVEESFDLYLKEINVTKWK